ncbi:hypothetical protein CDAR_16311, partial [Caerostris darwini]
MKTIFTFPLASENLEGEDSDHWKIAFGSGQLLDVVQIIICNFDKYSSAGCPNIWKSQFYFNVCGGYVENADEYIALISIHVQLKVFLQLRGVSHSAVVKSYTD